MYPYALSPLMEYYVKDSYFEDWGYQDHPKHWKPSDQYGGTPRWIQFNNNGKELSEPGKAPVISTQDAKDIYNLILSEAGCWPRDHITRRTVEEVKSKTGSWGRNGPLEPSDEWFMEGLSITKVPADTDSDGIPDSWEKLHGLNPLDRNDGKMIVPAGASEGNRHQGYTFIEFYINELADNSVMD
jgi:hypothetical protein